MSSRQLTSRVSLSVAATLVALSERRHSNTHAQLPSRLVS